MVSHPNKYPSSIAKKPPELLVSACLAGMPCTYRGKHNLKKYIKKLVETGKAIAVCPELLGGLVIPRERAEIVTGDGFSVLKKMSKVITISGKDVSKNYVAGAKKALSIARKYRIKIAILKSKSPSCGVRRIYNGTFRNVLKKGDGVLAVLLRQNGISIYTEKENFYG